MFKKGNKLYSIIRMKCPHCHKGDFFEGSIIKANVKDACEVCGDKYSKEPAFYQGSYYVVYALGVAVFVTIWGVMTLFFPEASNTALLITIVGGVLLAGPFMYPLSKIVWANLFFKYKNNKQ